MFFKNLTKKEKKHLKIAGGITTLKEFKKTAEAQKEMREKHPSIEPCFECKFIAKKLGLPV